jgi:hypothetical protein
MSYGNTQKDGLGTYYHLLVNAAGELKVAKAGAYELQSDVTANDSDKTFTVPTGYMWQIISIRVELVTTATVGNRQIVIELTDGTNVILRALAGIVQAASLTRYYNFYVGAPNLTAFIDTAHLANPLPDGMMLLSGYKVRVYDKAAVDAAADDMSVYMMVNKISV